MFIFYLLVIYLALNLYETGWTNFRKVNGFVFQMTGVVTPQDPKVLTGSSLTLQCRTEARNTSRNLYFESSSLNSDLDSLTSIIDDRYLLF